MDFLGQWVTLTFTLPVWFAICLALLLLIAAVSIWFLSQQKTQQIAQLKLDLSAAQSKPPVSAPAADKSITDLKEAYHHFLYNISHEVSNPLQSIQSNLDNISRCQPEETAQIHQYTTIALAEIRRLGRFLENLKTLSRLETGSAPVQVQAVNIRAVIEDVLMAQYEAAEAKKVEIKYEGPGRLVRIMGNRDQLFQVIYNLVDNAIKYSRPEGGLVLISIQESPNKIGVRVSDNGIGIPAEDLPNLFQTAYRAADAHSRRPKGSGIGLAIVRRIVEQHGGDIQVRSQPGQGTSFMFDLPLYSPQEP